MSGSHRHGSPGDEAAAPGFLQRWSERKRTCDDPADRRDQEDGREVPDVSSQPQHSPVERPQQVLTDQDMPPLETLNDDSDYSGFLSPGVSDALHRRALRKLFSAAKFQSRDGLDDYDTDYNLLVPLRRVVAEAVQDELTQHLQHRIQREAEQTPAAAAAGPPGVTARQPAEIGHAPQMSPGESAAEAGETDRGPDTADSNGFRSAVGASSAGGEGQGSAESPTATTVTRER